MFETQTRLYFNVWFFKLCKPNVVNTQPQFQCSAMWIRKYLFWSVTECALLCVSVLISEVNWQYRILLCSVICLLMYLLLSVTELAQKWVSVLISVIPCSWHFGFKAPSLDFRFCFYFLSVSGWWVRWLVAKCCFNLLCIFIHRFASFRFECASFLWLQVFVLQSWFFALGFCLFDATAASAIPPGAPVPAFDFLDPNIIFHSGRWWSSCAHST